MPRCSLVRLDENSIEQLLIALQNGRLCHPPAFVSLGRILPQELAHAVAHELQSLHHDGMSQRALEIHLESLLQCRREYPNRREQMELVLSGPDTKGVYVRDTAAVVQQLFRHAQRSVLLFGYAIHQGQQVFKTLSEQMKEREDLCVEFFLNIEREHQWTAESTSDVVHKYVENFQTRHWFPDVRMPRIYFDKRSLEAEHSIRSSLHAKSVVIDNRTVFISSANFTEAGQQRNIELGTRIESPRIARQIAGFFRGLQQSGIARPVN